MLNAIEKRRIRKIIYSKITLLVLTLLLVLLARGTWSVYKKAKYAKGNETRANMELANIRERETFLKNELEELKNERGREAQLRERFDIGKEGERLIVLVDTSVPGPLAPEQSKSVWQKVKTLFGFGE